MHLCSVIHCHRIYLRYGFRKVNMGPDAGAYAHDCFLKNRGELLGKVSIIISQFLSIGLKPLIYMCPPHTGSWVLLMLLLIFRCDECLKEQEKHEKRLKQRGIDGAANSYVIGSEEQEQASGENTESQFEPSTEASSDERRPYTRTIRHRSLGRPQGRPQTCT